MSEMKKEEYLDLPYLKRREQALQEAAEILQDTIPVGEVKAIGLLEVPDAIREVKAELARLRDVEKTVKELIAHQDKIASLPNVMYSADKSRLMNKLRTLTAKGE